jgi:hypothetical protein
VKHRSNKWHWKGDSQSPRTERSESDHSSTDTGEWPEGEGEPCRSGPRLQTESHGDGPELSELGPQLRTVLQLLSSHEHLNILLYVPDPALKHCKFVELGTGVVQLNSPTE